MQKQWESYYNKKRLELLFDKDIEKAEIDFLDKLTFKQEKKGLSVQSKNWSILIQKEKTTFNISFLPRYTQKIINDFIVFLYEREKDMEDYKEIWKDILGEKVIEKINEEKDINVFSYLFGTMLYETLSDEEIKILAKNIKLNKDENAKRKIAQSNLRLVTKIAVKNTKKASLYSLTLSDLINEGNIGLMKAIEEFNYTNDYTFERYATWWIKQAITRAISDRAKYIRVPTNIYKGIRKSGGK